MDLTLLFYIMYLSTLSASMDLALLFYIMYLSSSLQAWTSLSCSISCICPLSLQAWTSLSCSISSICPVVCKHGPHSPVLDHVFVQWSASMDLALLFYIMYLSTSMGASPICFIYPVVCKHVPPSVLYFQCSASMDLPLIYISSDLQAWTSYCAIFPVTANIDLLLCYISSALPAWTSSCCIFPVTCKHGPPPVVYFQ